ATKIVQQISSGNYDRVIIGIHEYALRPANNYGISQPAIRFWNQLQSFKAFTFVLGNVLATTNNFCSAKNLIACYQDDNISQQAAADLLTGQIVSMGRLPVSVCNYKYGDGMVHGGIKPERVVINNKFSAVDSIAEDA